jgi:hypothetical protein
MDPVTISGIVAGAGSLLGSGISAATGGSMNRKNRKWQEKMYKWQLQDQRDNAKMQWQENRDYAKWSYDNFESPIAQRAAYKAAGINPFVEGSVLQSMGATQGNASAPDSGSVPSGGPYQYNPGSAIQGGFQGLQGSAMQIVQAQNIQAQTELTNATRMKTLAETVGIENQNSLFQYVKAAAESDLLSKKFKNVMLEVQARFAEAEAIADLSERKARIAEIWSEYEKNLSQAAKNDADRVTVEQTRKFVVAQEEAKVGLIESQVETEGAKQDNLRSGAGLNRAQISRIEELTPAEKKEIRNRAAELANRMQNLSHEQKRRDLDLLLESAGLKNQNEPLLLTASLIKQVRTTIRTLELGGAIEKLFEEVYHVKL